MQFKLIPLILACAMAKGLMASPLAARDSTEVDPPNDYVELHREDAASGGSLVYYGPPSGTKTLRSLEPAKVEERASCSTTVAPSCSTSHTARNDVCDLLVTELQGDSTVPVGASPRQICYEGSSESNEYCCVSWHNVVPNLNKGDLAPYANTSKQPFPLSLLLAIPCYS
jgi:hypothetical protein